MYKYYFSHARTGLKYLLKDIIPQGYEILVPDFICDSVMHPIYQLNIKYKYYNINFDLKSNWIDLKGQINNKTVALLFVNYFGIPNEIDKYLEFSKKNKLILIEDNSHGYNGLYKNKLMGTFGDYGIASPRKHIDLKSGGILYSSKEIKLNLREYKFERKMDIYNSYIRKFINKNLFIKNKLKKIIKKRPKYENQETFREKPIQDFLIDQNSKEIIDNNNDDLMRQKSYSKFKKWEKFCINNNLEIIFDNYPEQINPWCYPVYVNNQNEQIKWFNWAWKNNVDLFSWPTLPIELVNKKTDSFKIWSKILCFSTR